MASRFPNKYYYEIGWGDAGFYQAKEITSGLTMRAIFWPTDTVVHVVGFNRNPREYFKHSEVKTLMLRERSYENMLKYIQSSFQLNDAKPTVLRKGIYGDSQFYRGTGSYYLFNTCNKWTAKALYSGGMDIGTTFSLTASSVMDSIASEEE